MTPAEAFAVLGLRPDAAWDDVRRAYRTLMRHHHPDRAGPTHAGAAAVVTEAFAVLRTTRAAGRSGASPGARSAAADRSDGARGATRRGSASSGAGSTRSAAGSATPAGGSTRPPSGSSGKPTAGGSGPGAAGGSRAGAQPSTTGGATGGPVRLLADDTIGIDGSVEEAFLLLLEAANDAGEVTYIDPDIGLLETIVSFPGTPVTSLVVTLQGRADHTEAFCTVEALDGSAPPALAAVVEVLADLARRRIGQPAPHPVRAPREWFTDAG